MNVALPQAQIDLGLSDSLRQWVITAYVLAFGALLLIGGRVADYMGRKLVYMVGMIGFASVWGGLAQTGIELVIARGIQSVFAALLAPAALALLTVTFPSGRERGTAFAVFGTVAGTGAAVGLVLGLSVLTTLFIGTQPLGPVSGYAAVYPVSAGCLFLAAIIAFTMLRDRRAPQPSVAAAASASSRG